jgi:dihydropteroate synthase
MIRMTDLAELMTAYPEVATRERPEFRIGSVRYAAAAIMGVVNLSPDSTYQHSVARNHDAAMRLARIAWAQGAAVVDLGAESTNAGAARVSPADQVRRLLPVVATCAEEGIAVSIETYDPDVAAPCLAEGAVVLNMTGQARERELYDVASEYRATVVLCYTAGSDSRAHGDAVVEADPIPRLIDYFHERVELAARHGVTNIVLDPGMGFYYANLTNPMLRLRYQTRVLLQSQRLAVLGLPLCQTLGHGFAVFEEEYRAAEGVFAVLAYLGGASLLRTHEVPLVRGALSLMESMDATAREWLPTA